MISTIYMLLLSGNNIHNPGIRILNILLEFSLTGKG